MEGRLFHPKPTIRLGIPVATYKIHFKCLGLVIVTIKFYAVLSTHLLYQVWAWVTKEMGPVFRPKKK